MEMNGTWSELLGVNTGMYSVCGGCRCTRRRIVRDE